MAEGGKRRGAWDLIEDAIAENDVGRAGELSGDELAAEMKKAGLDPARQGGLRRVREGRCPRVQGEARRSEEARSQGRPDERCLGSTGANRGAGEGAEGMSAGPLAAVGEHRLPARP
jgi:hypothetical protein